VVRLPHTYGEPDDPRPRSRPVGCGLETRLSQRVTFSAACGTPLRRSRPAGRRVGRGRGRGRRVGRRLAGAGAGVGAASGVGFAASSGVGFAAGSGVELGRRAVAAGPREHARRGKADRSRVIFHKCPLRPAIGDKSGNGNWLCHVSHAKTRASAEGADPRRRDRHAGGGTATRRPPASPEPRGGAVGGQEGMGEPTCGI
jgi:hypothetical protein